MSVSTMTDTIKITRRFATDIVGTELYSDESGGNHNQWGFLTNLDQVSEMQTKIRPKIFSRF